MMADVRNLAMRSIDPARVLAASGATSLGGAVLALLAAPAMKPLEAAR